MANRYSREVVRKTRTIVLEAASLSEIWPREIECPEGGCLQCDALRFIAAMVEGPHFWELRDQGYDMPPKSLEWLQEHVRQWPA